MPGKQAMTSRSEVGPGAEPALDASNIQLLKLRVGPRGQGAVLMGGVGRREGGVCMVCRGMRCLAGGGLLKSSFPAGRRGARAKGLTGISWMGIARRGLGAHGEGPSAAVVAESSRSATCPVKP